MGHYRAGGRRWQIWWWFLFDPNFSEDRILLMKEIIDNHASRVRSFDLSGLRPSILSELVKAPQGVGWQLSSRVRRLQSWRLRSIRRNINRHYQHNCPHFCIAINACPSSPGYPIFTPFYKPLNVLTSRSVCLEKLQTLYLVGDSTHMSAFLVHIIVPRTTRIMVPTTHLLSSSYPGFWHSPSPLIQRRMSAGALSGTIMDRCNISHDHDKEK